PARPRAGSTGSQRQPKRSFRARPARIRPLRRSATKPSCIEDRQAVRSTDVSRPGHLRVTVRGASLPIRYSMVERLLLKNNIPAGNKNDEKIWMAAGYMFQRSNVYRR